MTSTQSPSGRPSTSLHFAVGELSGKMDQLLASLLPQFQQIHEGVNSLDTRVTALERGQWMVLGGGTIIVFIVTAWEIVRYVIRL